MILVSACLLGQKVKYNGESNDHPLLMEYAARGQFLPICSECLGQLPIPRPPMEIQQGPGADVLAGKARVKNTRQEDFTPAFLQGAQLVLKTVQQQGIRAAILKANSPSCGAGWIYDGSFSRTKIPGDGVMAALLRAHGIRLYTEKDVNRSLLEELLSEDAAQKCS